MDETFIIVKPDAVKRRLIGRILSMFEEEGLSIVAMKMLTLTKEEAEKFYYVHRGKPFFESLTEYMSSGPVVVAVLEGDGAVERVRKVMGATNPEKAEKGTIRALFGLDIQRNSVHGSDSPESAEFEIKFFFS